jgi:hypothetical protein
LIGRDGEFGCPVAFFWHAIGLCPREPAKQDQRLDSVNNRLDEEA